MVSHNVNTFCCKCFVHLSWSLRSFFLKSWSLQGSFSYLERHQTLVFTTRMKLHLAKISVLALLINVMSPNSPKEIYEQALKCFASWVDFGVPLPDAEQIVVQMFQSLNSEHLFDTAVDTLVKVFSTGDAERWRVFRYIVLKNKKNPPKLLAVLKLVCLIRKRKCFWWFPTITLLIKLCRWSRC